MQWITSGNLTEVKDIAKVSLQTTWNATGFLHSNLVWPWLPYYCWWHARKNNIFSPDAML